MTEPEVEATQGRCCLCPHPADLNNNLTSFPHPPLTQAPWTQMPCGHRIHTVCFALNVLRHGSENPRSFGCEVCGASIFTPEQTQWWINDQRTRWREPPADLTKLWTEREDFRESLRAFKEAQKGYGALEAKANADITEIKKQFINAVRLPIEQIKEQQRRFKREIMALESRRKVKASFGRLFAKQRLIEETYDVNYRDLENLKRQKGVPKFRLFSRWRRWRSSISYMFRVIV
jgi:hypothetical protein